MLTSAGERALLSSWQLCVQTRKTTEDESFGKVNAVFSEFSPFWVFISKILLVTLKMQVFKEENLTHNKFHLDRKELS